MIQFLYNVKSIEDTNFSDDLSAAEIKMTERRLLRIGQREDFKRSERSEFKTLWIFKRRPTKGQDQNTKEGMASGKTYSSLPRKGQQCKGGKGEDGFWGDWYDLCNTCTIGGMPLSARLGNSNTKTANTSVTLCIHMFLALPHEGASMLQYQGIKKTVSVVQLAQSSFHFDFVKGENSKGRRILEPDHP